MLHPHPLKSFSPAYSASSPLVSAEGSVIVIMSAKDVPPPTGLYSVTSTPSPSAVFTTAGSKGTNEYEVPVKFTFVEFGVRTKSRHCWYPRSTS